MVAYVNPELDIVSVEINGISSAPLPLFGEEEGALKWPELLFIYEALPDRGIDVKIQVRTDGLIELLLQDQSYGLPDIPGMSIEPMPNHIMPQANVSDFPHQTVVIKSFTIGGGG